jgi:hypothetical protein
VERTRVEKGLQITYFTYYRPTFLCVCAVIPSYKCQSAAAGQVMTIECVMCFGHSDPGNRQLSDGVLICRRAVQKFRNRQKVRISFNLNGFPLLPYARFMVQGTGLSIVNQTTYAGLYANGLNTLLCRCWLSLSHLGSTHATLTIGGCPSPSPPPMRPPGLASRVQHLRGICKLEVVSVSSCLEIANWDEHRGMLALDTGKYFVGKAGWEKAREVYNLRCVCVD